jgi:hypothetical protein
MALRGKCFIVRIGAPWCAVWIHRPALTSHSPACPFLPPQEELQHWRTKIATNTREWEERNGALRREKELMSRHYAQLKAALDGGRQQQAARLKALSINAGEAIKVRGCRLGGCVRGGGVVMCLKGVSCRARGQGPGMEETQQAKQAATCQCDPADIVGSPTAASTPSMTVDIQPYSTPPTHSPFPTLDCPLVPVLQELRKKLAKAESILKLAEVCRKMETEQEKVLPFWSLGEAVPVPDSPCLPQEVLEQMQEQAALMEEVEQEEDRMGEVSASGQVG